MRLTYSTFIFCFIFSTSIYGLPTILELKERVATYKRKLNSLSPKISKSAKVAPAPSEITERMAASSTFTDSGSSIEFLKLSSSQKEKLTSNGYLTEELIFEILKEKGLIPETLLINGELSGSPQLLIQAEKGGRSTEFLYLVKYSKHYSDVMQGKKGIGRIFWKRPPQQFLKMPLEGQEYKTYLIIKGLRRDSSTEPSIESREAKNLQLVKNSPLGKLPYSTYPEMARMTFDETIYAYNDPDNRSHFFSIIHAARGESLAHLYEEYKEDNFEKLCEIFERVGKAIGLFHLYNAVNPSENLSTMRTYVHGDFHWNNIHYKEMPDGKYRVYLIDNETFAQSLNKPESITKDIDTFYTTPMYVWKKKFKDRNINLNALYQAFIIGYTKAYPAKKQERVLEFLCNCLSGCCSIKS